MAVFNDVSIAGKSLQVGYFCMISKASVNAAQAGSSC